MLGFGRKKIQMNVVVTAFLDLILQEVTGRLQEVRAAIGDRAESISDDHLKVELYPAALSIGVQPVRNIWDANTFESVRREIVRQIESLYEPEMSYFFKLRLDEYFTEWQNNYPKTKGNLPWDAVAGRLISNLGLADDIGDRALISGMSIMGVSGLLVTMPAMYWKNVKKQFKLS